MHKSIKPIILSSHFLIGRSPLGQQIRGLVEGLERFNYEPTIVCIDDHGNIEWNYSRAELVQLRQSLIIKWIIAIIRRILPDLSFLPDTEYYSWGGKAYRRSLSLLTSEKFDYIHSVSFSCACHLVGLKLKHKTGLPWIVHCYDPWYDNPDRRFKTKFLKKKDLEMESKVAKNADAIILYSERMYNIWSTRYGKDISKKIVYIPMSVKEDGLATTYKRECGTPLQISHIGNFVLKRNSSQFIEAVSILLNKRPDLRGKFVVNYVGRSVETDLDMIRRKELSDVFNIVGLIPEEKCKDYYQKADIFLAIDATYVNNVFYPSKVIKYFYYRKPILGISPNGGVLSEELNKSRHSCFDNKDIHGIVSFLERALDDYESLLSFDMHYWEQFSLSHVVAKYNEVVEKLIDKPVTTKE